MKKKTVKTVFKKLLCSAAALLLVCLLLPVTADAASIRLNKTNLTLSIGKTYTLKVSGTKARTRWTSTRTNVATVSQKGVVKAKAPGKTAIRAKVGRKIYTCNVTVNANAKAKGLRFQTLDNGMFIQGSSGAKITFALDRPSVNVTVSVKASNGSVVYKSTFRSCKANTTYSVTWNGKKGGTAAASGTYTAVVKAGSIQTTSPGLIVRCTVKDCYITGTACAGMLGHRNNETGLITNCRVSGGSIHLSRNGNGDIWSSALIVDNFGSLMDSDTASVSMLGTVHWGSVLSAGVVRWNTGKASACGATDCTMAAERDHDDPNARVHEERTAGVCELNEGNISDCYSSGCTAKADGVYENKGIVR